MLTVGAPHPRPPRATSSGENASALAIALALFALACQGGAAANGQEAELRSGEGSQEPSGERALEPWEPADPAFAGCAESCGQPASDHVDGVVAQPGARPGDRTYCPVSGVVFEVDPEAARGDAHTSEVGGEPIYLCCGACAEYFEAHGDEIARARGYE